jgi:hypothetical protein
MNASSVLRPSRIWPAMTVAVMIGTVSQASCATFNFAGSLDGWQPHWHKESQTGTDGTLSLDSTRGFDDAWSLRFDMGDGAGDDGTLWIEWAFPAVGVSPVPVQVEFQLFSVDQSDFNQFEVKAFVGGDDPEGQTDFTTIGQTNRVGRMGGLPIRINCGPDRRADMGRARSSCGVGDATPILDRQGRRQYCP